MNTPVKTAIDLPMAQIIDFCERWKIVRMELFGSVLREDFSSDSDVDVMITFADEEQWGLFEMFDMNAELAIIFGRDVDLITRPSIEKSRNYIRRKAILAGAKTIYEQ